MNSTFWHFILISAIGLSCPAGSVWGDCSENYPNSDVTKQLGKAEYRNCTLDVMVKNYAALLQDEQRLLTSLRPAFMRKLDKEVANDNLEKKQREVRLADYDSKLSALLEMKESLESWVKEVEKDSEGDAVKEISTNMKNKLTRQLTRCQKNNQALKRKITRAKDELTSAEIAEFCKLDFFLRVGEGLNPKISECLKSSN